MYTLVPLGGPLGRGDNATVWGARRPEGGGTPSMDAYGDTDDIAVRDSSVRAQCTLALKRRFRRTTSQGLVEGREIAFYRALRSNGAPESQPHLLRLVDVLYTDPVDPVASPGGVDETLVLCPALEGTAREWVERRWFSRGLRVPLSWVGLVMHGVMSALAEVHRLGWVHRGVTLDNILVSTESCGDPRVVLGGFGQVHVSGEGADSSATPAYARSPEVLTGQCPMAQPAQDVWAAGTVLGHLLLGRPLFPHEAGGRRGAEELRVLEGIVRAVGLDCTPLLPAAAASVAVARDASLASGPSAVVRPSHGLDRLLAPSHAKDLLLAMLSSDPRDRPTAEQCLASPFLCNFSHESKGERQRLIARLIR